jgi:hypothetical protein
VVAGLNGFGTVGERQIRSSLIGLSFKQMAQFRQAQAESLQQGLLAILSF